MCADIKNATNNNNPSLNLMNLSKVSHRRLCTTVLITIQLVIATIYAFEDNVPIDYELMERRGLQSVQRKNGEYEISSSEEKDDSSVERDLQIKKGSIVRKYTMVFEQCVDIALNDINAPVNIACQYTLEPSGADYLSDLLDYDLETDRCLTDVPSPIAFIPEGDETGTVTNGDFTVNISVDPDALDIQPGETEKTVYFCVRNFLIDSGTRFRYRRTKVKVTFQFGGAFRLEILVEPIGDAPTEDGINLFEFDQPYNVLSYQCLPEPPYTEFAGQIGVGDKVAICVETDSPDTYVERVKTFKLDQGSEPPASYVEGGKPRSGRAQFNCLLTKPGSDVIGSMCAIIISPDWDQFGETAIDIKGSGEVELRINVGDNRKRELYENYNYNRQPAHIEEVLSAPYAVLIRVDLSGTCPVLTRKVLSILILLGFVAPLL